ncbi:cytochrome P450 [Lophiotrema nucula]|uniref:Cytochrome P450 n=1 Tax=Lophiotrema nucula TaxID=690887 RepID=A0A6A5Z4E5_9PLEO|nr:cytochrome P450 [Lophiotrema nucula]
MESMITIPNVVAAFGSTVIIGTVWICFQVVRIAYDPDLREIPGPLISTFTNIPLKIAILRGRRSVYIHALHEQYGPYVRIAPREIAIADFDAFRTIHRIGSDFNKGPWYQGQAPGQDSDDNSGVFCVLSNKAASHRRRRFQAAGTRKVVAEWEPQVVELVDLTVHRIQHDLQHRGESDVMKWWTFLASDVTGSLAFGEPFGNVQNGERSALVRDIEAAMPIIGMRIELPWTKPILDGLPTWCGNSWSPLFERFVGYGQDAVRATRAAQAGGSKTLFSKMVVQDEKEQEIPDDLIEKEARNVIVAGTDTTAMTLTYLTYAVLKHEQIKQRLVAELKRLSTRPTWGELENAKLLNNVIQETMRLYPAIPGSLMRTVPAGGAHLGGFVLPTGTQVATQAWTFHRDANVFDQPLRFNPDRWDNSTPAMKEHMMAFGGPTRICLGQNIARLEILYAVSTLFRTCPDITLAPSTTDNSMEMVDYFAIKPKAGKCVVIPV